MCVEHLTFINPPESGVRAAVFPAGVLAFIHIYNVPVFSADGHGEQDETEQPTQTRADDNCPKVHFHQRSNPSYDSLSLSTCYFHSVPLKPRVFRSDTLKHISLSLLLQLCPGWRRNQLSAHAGWRNCVVSSISPAQLYMEWEQKPLNTESTWFSHFSFSCDHSLWFICSPQRRGCFFSILCK